MNTNYEFDAQDFVDEFIATKDDGHPFFMYKDFIEENGRQPDPAEIEKSIEAVDFYNAVSDIDPERASEKEAMVDRFEGDYEFRQEVLELGTAYINDVDWKRMLEEWAKEPEGIDYLTALDAIDTIPDNTPQRAQTPVNEGSARPTTPKVG
ncbi:MAG: hypothetical protein ACYCY2_03065 [Acidithiobacillus ferriphilus]